MTQRTTVIGTSMRTDGSIAGDGNVVVRGHFEGAIHIGGTLTVAPGAVVRADVVAAHVVVDGCLEGDVRSTGVVRITSRGMLAGDVSGDLDLEAAGVHRGEQASQPRGRTTEVSSEIPEPLPVNKRAHRAATVPRADRPEPPPPGTTRDSLRRTGPPSDPGMDTVKYFGEPGRTRDNEPNRGDLGDDWSIATGEPQAVATDGVLDAVADDRGPLDFSQWTDVHEAPTLPRDAGDGPLRLSVDDLVADVPPPPRVSPDSVLEMPGVGDGTDDPTDLPRGKTELMIPNPPVRRTTTPGNSPVRRAFGRPPRRDTGTDDDA